MEKNNIIGWLRFDNKLDATGNPSPHSRFTLEDEAMAGLFGDIIIPIITSVIEFDEFERLLTHAPNGIVFSDASGYIKFINERAKEIFGSSIEKLKDNPVSILYHDKEKAFEMGEMLQNSPEGKITGIEIYARGSSDERIPIRLTLKNIYSHVGQRLGTIGYFEDLRPLVWQETLTQTLINKIPDYIYIKDIHSKFILSNLETAKRMGVEKPSDLIGKTDFDFYPHSLAQEFYEDEQKIVTSGYELIAKEEQVVDLRTNQWGWISSTKVPVLAENGRVMGLVGIGRDMTTIREENQKIQSLYNAVDNFIKTDDPDRILDLAVTRTREAANAKWCSVILVDDNGQALALEDDPHDEIFTKAMIRIEGFTSKIVSEARHIAIEDITKESRYQPCNFSARFSISSWFAHGSS